MSMTYEELELNGCYATLCEALRARIESNMTIRARLRRKH